MSKLSDRTEIAFAGKTRLEDIAVRLNVSRSLVSKVLNQRLGTTVVRPELAERIRQTAEELGYQKNRSAAALSKGRHGAFGVLIHRTGTASSGLIENLLQGISREANDRHQTLTLDFYETNEQFHELTDIARRGVIDGLIVAGVAHPEVTEHLLNWSRGGMHVVTLHNEPLHESIVNVGIDQIEVGYIATKHLIDRGCRRIAELMVADDRHDGYARALREAGLPYAPALVKDVESPEPTPYARKYAVSGLKALLESGVAFDGLFAHCDEHAMDAERVLLEAGLQIPRDVKLVSIDNAPYCDLGIVPITSVSQSYTKRGRVAVELLLELIDGRKVESLDVAPDLVIRKSSGR